MIAFGSNIEADARSRSAADLDCARRRGDRMMRRREFITLVGERNHCLLYTSDAAEKFRAHLRRRGASRRQWRHATRQIRRRVRLAFIDLCRDGHASLQVVIPERHSRLFFLNRLRGTQPTVIAPGWTGRIHSTWRTSLPRRRGCAAARTSQLGVEDACGRGGA